MFKFKYVARCDTAKIQFRGTLLECECASGKKSKLITKLSYVSGKEQLKFHH